LLGIETFDDRLDDDISRRDLRQRVGDAKACWISCNAASAASGFSS
jgi:hypothetical protein